MRGHTSRARLLARPPPWAGPALDSGKDSEDRRPGRAALIREAGPLNRGVFTTRIAETANGTYIEIRAIARSTTESKVEKTE